MQSQILREKLERLCLLHTTISRQEAAQEIMDQYDSSQLIVLPLGDAPAEEEVHPTEEELNADDEIDDFISEPQPPPLPREEDHI